MTRMTSYRPGARCAFSRMLTDSRSRPPVSAAITSARRSCRAWSAPSRDPSDDRRSVPRSGRSASARADLRALVGVVHRHVRALRDEHVEDWRRAHAASVCETSGNSSGVLSSRVRSGHNGEHARARRDRRSAPLRRSGACRPGSRFAVAAPVPMTLVSTCLIAASVAGSTRSRRGTSRCTIPSVTRYADDAMKKIGT